MWLTLTSATSPHLAQSYISFCMLILESTSLGKYLWGPCDAFSLGFFFWINVDCHRWSFLWVGFTLSMPFRLSSAAWEFSAAYSDDPVAAQIKRGLREKLWFHVLAFVLVGTFIYSTLLKLHFFAEIRIWPFQPLTLTEYQWLSMSLPRLSAPLSWMARLNSEVLRFLLRNVT